jgi:hypothetical protein
MAERMDTAQDDEFAAFLQEAFQWTDAETTQNATVLFPGLHPSSQNIPRSSPFGGALFSALTQQQPQQQQPQQQQPHAWHAWHNAAAAAGQPLLHGLMPNLEQSAALSAQILHLQAQHQQQLHEQQLHAAVLNHPAESDYQQQQKQQQKEVQTLIRQEEPQQQQQQQQQARRRGRPPKQSGKYCQGYVAMQRSRQKKKAEVSPA